MFVGACMCINFQYVHHIKKYTVWKYIGIIIKEDNSVDYFIFM